MAIQTNLGRVQPLYQGTYNSTTTYNRLDNVYYNGSTWVCLADGVVGVMPDETSNKWQKVASQGGTGSFGTPLAAATGLEAGATPTVSVEASGPDTAKVFSFNFGIPKGDVGEAGVQSVVVSATGRKQDDSGDLVAGDDPWATASLDTEDQELTMRFGIPPGHDGQGAVSKVDSIEPTSGNVNLGAVSYGRVQSLSSAQQAQARANIDAQEAGDYIEEPSTKDYGTFLQYGGSTASPTWVAAPINQVPSGGLANYVLRKQTNTYGWTPIYEIPEGGAEGAVLVKNSSTNYDVGWAATITNSDIDDIISE